MFKILSDFFLKIIEKIYNFFFLKKTEVPYRSELNISQVQHPVSILKNPDWQLEFSKFKLKPLNIEFNCTPKKNFENSNPKNENELGVLPTDMWITIFSFLSVPEICTVMASCKFLGEITNERQFREALYMDKMNRAINVRHKMFFEEPLNSGINKIITQPLQNLINQMPVWQNLPLILGEDILEQPGEQGYTLKRPSV